MSEPIEINIKILKDLINNDLIKTKLIFNGQETKGYLQFHKEDYDIPDFNSEKYTGSKTLNPRKYDKGINSFGSLNKKEVILTTNDLKPRTIKTGEDLSM